jgi:hypothetical protein
MSTQNQAYQYYLLPSANPPLHLVGRHNQIYKFWKDSWLEVLQQLNADASQLEDDFLRQDFVAAICSDTEVIAVHLYSIFALDTDASLEHRYLKGNYPPEFFANLKSKEVRTVMSMEYLTVSQNWRKSRGAMHMGAVIGALGLKVMQHYGIDAVIAPARRDHKVNLMAYSQGGDCIVENVLNHKVPCDLIAIRRNRIKEPALELVLLRDQLWQERIHVDATGVVHNPSARILKLAA